MERLTRIAGIWNWLPAFRAVAETEHLPSAARAMRLSPSALSRSVTQLEASLDRKLFVRSKRRMQLDPAGHTLLTAVRDAMRRIDDAVAEVSASPHTAIRIAGDGSWLGLIVAPMLAELGLELEHVEIDPASVQEAVLRGIADLAIVESAVASDDVVIERLGTVPRAVFTSSKRRGSRDLVHVVRPDDGWPPQLARKIGFSCAQLGPAIEACRSGSMCAALPVAIARAHGLRVMSAPALSASQLYLVRRIPLGATAIESLLDAIRTRVRSLLAA